MSEKVRRGFLITSLYISRGNSEFGRKREREGGADNIGWVVDGGVVVIVL